MNINPKPKPPFPGGEYTHVSDPGTPPLPPGVKVVGLIPVGDGGPQPLLPRVARRKKRKPIAPSRAETEKLPRWARVAFAARCARRVFPILRHLYSRIDSLEALEAAVAVAERGASGQGATEMFAAAAAAYRASDSQSYAVLSACNAAADADHEGGVYLAARTAALAADVAYYAALADPNPVRFASDVAATAAAAMLRVATDPADLSFIRWDFERFRRLAKKHGWTDDTSVPTDIVGPLWPRGRTPHWAREKKKPRE